MANFPDEKMPRKLEKETITSKATFYLNFLAVFLINSAIAGKFVCSE
jgi:hypothetical protein